MFLLVQLLAHLILDRFYENFPAIDSKVSKKVFKFHHA